MVKRPKSPEIVEDARFFTVYQPYPLNPDWHEEDDQIEAAKWVAECIGPNHLWAIHEKPRAGNMILLEISKDFVDHGLLLGEHRWAEFLKDPTPEEKPRVTQVFHSFYARGRDAQKDGWKVIAVNSRWLHKWVPGEEKIRHPYPETHWCTPPVEDRTNKTLCRPLPTRTLPIEPPPRPPAPVVGSSTWVAKQTEASPSIKPSVLGAWSKPSVGPIDTKDSQAVERDRSTPSAISPQSGTSAGRAEFPSLSTANLTPLNGKNAWGKPVPLKKFVAEEVKANAVKGKSRWAPNPQPASPSGAKSPLAEQPPKGPVNAWASPIKIPPALRTKPSPTPTTPSTRSQSPWGTLETAKEPWSTEDIDQQDENKEKSSNTRGPGGNSNWSTHPSAPHNGRSGDLPRERERDASRHKSTSRTPADPGKSKENEYETVDFTTLQRDKHSAWDVPSAEPVDKKARDKGKKKANDTEDNWGAKPKKGKDTGEAMDFEAADEVADSFANKDKGKKKEIVGSLDVGARFDWASEPLVDPGYDEDPQMGGQPLQTPNVKLMDVDTPADYGERGPVSTNEKNARSPPRQPKSWGKIGRPESPYKGKKFDSSSPRNSEFNSRDGSRSRKSTASPIKVKDFPPGRSDGQWDHSGFAELEPKKKFDKPKEKFDKPRDTYDKARDKYDKPRGRNDDKTRDIYDDKHKDRFDKPKDKFDKSGEGKFDKLNDKKPSASSSKNIESFDWSTPEGEVEDWGGAPPETDTKDKGKRRADENAEDMDFDATDWGSKPVHGSEGASMEVDEPLADWDAWGPPPSDTRKGKAKSADTSKNAAMDVDTPKVDWGEWGPPPPSPKKGSSSAVGIESPEPDWGEWGPPPPSHLKKNVQSKVFRSDTPLKPSSNKKGKNFESDRRKPAYKDSTKDSAAMGSKAPEWGPPPASKNGSKNKLFKAETPKATPKNAAMVIDVPEAGWGPPSDSTKGPAALKDGAVSSDTTKTDRGGWGPPLSSDSKKEPKAGASGVDDNTDWGHVPHKTKKLAGKMDGKSANADITENRSVAPKEDANIGKLEDWLLPSVSESTKDSTIASSAKDAPTGDWGAWSTSAPNESKKSFEKKSDGVDTADSGTQGNLEDWGVSPAPKEPMKPTKHSTTSNTDIGFEAEDWGLAPLPEKSSSSAAKDDFGTKSEDWGLGPDDEVDELEFHPWEKNATTVPSAWGSTPTDIRTLGLDTSPTWKRDPNLLPTRPRGSKRGRRVRKKKEPPVIGRLRGFEDVDREEFEKEEDHAEEANEGETAATAVGVDKDRQAPIGGKLEDWGVQSSTNAWS